MHRSASHLPGLLVAVGCSAALALTAPALAPSGTAHGQAVTDARPSLAPPPRPGGRLALRPLLGANYAHVAYPGCRLDDGGILAGQGGAATRRSVVRQLQVMRQQGVQSLRLLVWHMHDPSRHRWGVVSSAGGSLDAGTRANLVHLARAVRAAGYTRLTVSFSPQWTNSPFLDEYDPALLEENWSFLEDVRSVVLAEGPPQVRFDLLNEGGMSDYLPPARQARLRSYVAAMYTRYGRAHGTRDVTVSTIPAADRADHGNRLRNLLTVLAGTGQPLPAWFDVHLNVSPASARYGLEDTDRVLRAAGLPQPVVVGEAPYDDPAVARALAASRAAGRLDEVLEWVDRPGDTCNTSPPYAVTAYRAALLPPPPHGRRLPG